MYDVKDFDPEALAEFATQILDRPGDMGVWDDRLYSTHGGTISWAERSDAILSESNYLMALDRVLADSGLPEGEDVIDGSFGHWAVGSLRQICVRVYVWDEENEAPSDEYTQAFLSMYSIGKALKEYPVLDESDFSERENEAWDTAYVEALASARNSSEELENALEEDPELEYQLSRLACEDVMFNSSEYWIDPEWFVEALPAAQKARADELAKAAGQTTLGGL